MLTTDMYGLGVSEQRDMLIDQGRMGEGMLFGKSVDAVPTNSLEANKKH